MASVEDREAGCANGIRTRKETQQYEKVVTPRRKAAIYVISEVVVRIGFKIRFIVALMERSRSDNSDGP